MMLPGYTVLRRTMTTKKSQTQRTVYHEASGGQRTWNLNSVAGSGGPTVPVCRLGGGCVKNEAAHLCKRALADDVTTYEGRSKRTFMLSQRELSASWR